MTHPTIPLLERFPGLRGLHRVPIGSLPTPVTPELALAAAAGVRGLHFKRDDASAAAYGGNKVRKLEFLLGEALALGATDVITFGAAGSNHALATAIHGAAAGLKVHSMLIPQHDAPYVGRNLLASTAMGADLRFFEDAEAAQRGAVALRAQLRADSGHEPLVVPFGGTTPVSTAGFVNAAFELAEQVAAGELPEPDFVYATLGSMGTAAGLALGLRAAGMRTKVVAVQVIADGEADTQRLLALVRATQEALRDADASFPAFEWSAEDVRVASGFVGEGYAIPTEQGSEAIALAREEAGARLDGTYTGKTLAALIADGRAGLLAGRDVLFWDSYNSRDYSALVDAGDPALLPDGLRAYVHEGSARA